MNNTVKQHQILSIIIFIILGFVLYKLGTTFFVNRSQVVNKSETKKDFKLVDMSLVNEISINPNTKYGSVSGVYPYFRNAVPSFNDHVRNSIVIAQAEFENNAKENWQARIDTALPGENIPEFPEEGDFSFMTKVNYTQVNEDFISFTIIVAGYSGGAHGYESIISFNYDVKNSKEISMSDLFPNNPDYLTTVANYSRKDLREQFVNKIKRADFENDGDYKMTLENIDAMIIPGTEPVKENFSVFTIEPGFINIYFTQYQVAAYVYGSQMVKMPLN